MFGRHWETAIGTIVDSRIDIARFSSAQTDPSCVDREFVVDLTTVDGEQFRTKVVGPRRFGDWWTPRIGTEVRFRYDRRRGKVTFDTTDPAISFTAHMKARERSFAETLAAPVSTSRDPRATSGRSPFVLGGVTSAVTPEQLNEIIAAALANATVVRAHPPGDRTPSSQRSALCHLTHHPRRTT